MLDCGTASPLLKGVSPGERVDGGVARPTVDFISLILGIAESGNRNVHLGSISLSSYRRYPLSGRRPPQEIRGFLVIVKCGDAGVLATGRQVLRRAVLNRPGCSFRLQV